MKPPVTRSVLMFPWYVTGVPHCGQTIRFSTCGNANTSANTNTENQLDTYNAATISVIATAMINSQARIFLAYALTRLSPCRLTLEVTGDQGIGAPKARTPLGVRVD
jgi:hypothetical protein